MSDRRLQLPGGRLAFGGDYNPDQWPRDTWAQDVTLMARAGVTLVTLPVFSWPLLEPEPGRFDLEWLAEVVDLLWSAGIAVDLATGTATPPAWLVRSHPEVRPVSADGVRLEFGSRQGYCPSSPVFRAHAVRLATALADRFGDHPALALWHVSNEYGDHVARCWCPVSADAFRAWLQARYGSLAALNDAWGTACWGQHYTSWEHVGVPAALPGPGNPGQRHDFARFSSDAVVELLRAEADVLRSSGRSVPVTTNFMGLFADLDYRDLAAEEDLVTDDAYPDPADPRSPVDVALSYGLMRCLKPDRPWLLLESAPSAVSWRPVNVPKRPGRMRVDALQAVAHGSDGAMFFQWRAARVGPERFHSALLGHRGERSRSFAEASALGTELARLAPLAGTTVRAAAAVVWDYDTAWALAAPDSLPSDRLDHHAIVTAWHAALVELGLTVDVVAPGGPYLDHPLVVAPALHVLSEESAAALTAYVRGGGHLVVGPFSGVVDRTERVHPGGAPGPLRDLLGVQVDEWWPLVDDDVVHLGPEGRWAARTWSEWLEADVGTEVVARYADSPLAGRPAVTRRASGAGAAWYVSALLDHPGLTALLRRCATGAGVTVADRTVPGLEVVTRTDGTTAYTTVLNHGPRPVRLTHLPEGSQVLSGPATGSPTRLGGHDAVVLAHPDRGPVAAEVLSAAQLEEAR